LNPVAARVSVFIKNCQCTLCLEETILNKIPSKSLDTLYLNQYNFENTGYLLL